MKIRSLSFSSALREGHALIIVPPFTRLDRPAFSAHLLQACAKEAGFRVSVLYANVVFAARIGEPQYEMISCIPELMLFGERLFTHAAYGTRSVSSRQWIDAKVSEWADEVAEGVVQRGFKVVGCSTMFQQTSASVALLNRIKRLSPTTVTIIGGANCAGEMAEGIASVGGGIDFVFSGESEVAFPEFLGRVLGGTQPSAGIVYGQRCRDLDALPTPEYIEFFEQRERYLPVSSVAANRVWLLAESSRGCWWGEKHQCTFCGDQMAFRVKSPDRVVSELRTLLEENPSQTVQMVDNILPHSYLRTLIPRLTAEVPGLRLFYMVRPYLALEQLVALKRAGMRWMLAGIEALSSSLLRRMNKGVLARRNVTLLRCARSVGIDVTWNLLWGFPGDELGEYEETLMLLPLLRHLHPPASFTEISLDRFSPYVDHPEDYGITNMRPLAAYASVFPADADVAKLAYYFEADYSSASREHPDLIRVLQREVSAWREAWQSGAPPRLSVTRLPSGHFLLIDERGLPGTQKFTFLSHEEASVALVGQRFAPTGEIQWALERRLGVELDSWYVPLATAEPELLKEFETERQATETKAVERREPVLTSFER